MNLDKAKKRIAKKVKMGFQGHPVIAISYYGKSLDIASEVLITLTPEEGADAMEERFKSDVDARENEVIQSAIVKMIERSDAKTVTQADGVSIST